MSAWVLLHGTVMSSGVPIKDRDRYNYRCGGSYIHSKIILMSCYC